MDRYQYVLILVEQNQEKLTQKALAGMLQVDKSFMVNMINYLTENGFVYREINTEDRREHLIKLTDKAKKMIPSINQFIKELNSKAFYSLPDEKIKTFFEIIETLQNNLNLISNHETILDYQRLKS
ncbi:MAG: MarR family transcriptional regulator [Bacteroidetes bacterium]|nr:MarR family transcriptional regulator [Bacteroidota bacterium]MBU2267405.1 MarR family transcriptional regulator [Bacteroidota bacterium]MBU2375817.1 MarR family transcriptional regulator [Bacteroidota bacterium]